MNRRSFLTRASAAIAALAIDPEELLWKPTKTIFIPKPAGLMFHKDAFTMNAVRVHFDIKQNKFISRLDVLYGYIVCDQEALRLYGINV